MTKLSPKIARCYDGNGFGKVHYGQYFAGILGQECRSQMKMQPKQKSLSLTPMAINN